MQRGELSWNLGFGHLAVSDSPQEDFKEERKGGLVEVGLELQHAGQRGECAIDTGDQLPELILYIKVDCGVHCGGVKILESSILIASLQIQGCCNNTTFLYFIKAN